MLKPRSERSRRDGAQFAIAVFDSWDALLCFLKKERIGTPSTSDAVFTRVRTIRRPTLRSGLLKEMTELRFTRARGAIAWTSGPIADELASRSTGGAVNLANALRVWLSSEQAWELASHVEKGHRSAVGLNCEHLRSSVTCVGDWCKRARIWSSSAISNSAHDSY